MENQKIVIDVMGACGSGKTRITYLLKQFLKEKGFVVEFDGGIDFDNEASFDEHISHNINETIDVLKNNRIIELHEIQLHREAFKYSLKQ